MNQIVDNNTYNLITALASNLEAYNAYQKYAKDGNSQLWQQLSQQTQQAVQLLQQALQQTMSGQGNTQSYGATGTQGNYGTSSQSTRTF